jgi:endonuclease/exonuclease/phosphatase family metal-dependent hydrolase
LSSPPEQDPAGEDRLDRVTDHKADLEHSPWVLVVAFVVIAAGLFGIVRLAGSGGPEPTTPTTAAASSPAASVVTQPAIDPSSTAAATGDLNKRLERLLRRKVEATQPHLTTVGPVGTLTAPVGGPVTGEITTATANLPNRDSAGFPGSMRVLTAGSPDFVTLNEVSNHPTAAIDAAAPGYTAFRVEAPDRSRGGAGQSMNNVVVYRTDRWTRIAGGRVRVVDQDAGFLHGHAFVWNRYVTWALLKRTSDGAIVSLCSLHMPTNPARYPAEHGRVGMSRVAKYANGMNEVLAVVAQLRKYGPVLLGGDMNSHPGQGSWTAAAKMTSAGYSYNKDSGVMYLFYPSGARLVARRQVHVASDHPAIITTIDMNGVGPA